MEVSRLCAYGRSKEKRDDCKIVVLATVVNSDGLLSVQKSLKATDRTSLPWKK